MSKLFSPQLLYSIRNQIPIDNVIENILILPCKQSEGYWRYLCPKCHEFRTACNSKTNLVRCFLCCENFNSIDIVMLVKGYSFVETVKFLQPLLLVQK